MLRRGGRIMGRSVRGAEVCCTFFNNQSVGVVVLDWSFSSSNKCVTPTLRHYCIHPLYLIHGVGVIPVLSLLIVYSLQIRERFISL